LVDEDLATLWRRHLELGDRATFEAWARARERLGFFEGMELLRAGRRWDRVQARSIWLREEKRQRDEEGAVFRLDDALESAEATAVRLYERARKATRALRRIGRLPRCPASALELHVLSLEGQRALARDAILAERIPRFTRRRAADAAPPM
jgi:hypothetical protein